MPSALILRIHDEYTEVRGDRRAKRSSASLVAETPLQTGEYIAAQLRGSANENARIHSDAVARRAKCAGTAKRLDLCGSAQARNVGPDPISAFLLLRLKKLVVAAHPVDPKGAISRQSAREALDDLAGVSERKRRPSIRLDVIKVGVVPAEKDVEPVRPPARDRQ